MSRCSFHLLNLNKPSGLTSRDVVNRVQRLVRPAKAGHAGTLDPLASGVLVCCLGEATRLIEYVQRMKKRYRGTFLLGCRSNTEDIEGEVEKLPDSRRPTLEEITRAAGRMTGEILQRPPEFSALKVAGQRAYALARRGVTVDLEPRPITVYRLEVVRFDYPELELDIECGSGTYVRSLGRDLAEAVGTSAVMSALTRTAIGDFTLAKAVDADFLTAENLPNHLLKASAAVGELPRVEISDLQRRALAMGQSIELTGDRLGGQHSEVAAFDSSGELVAIIGPRETNAWRPLRNFGVESLR